MPEDRMTPEAAQFIDVMNKFGEITFPIVAIYPYIREVVAIGAAPGLAYNAFQWARNRHLTDGSENAICLYAASLKTPRMEYVDIATGKKGLITNFFTNKGVRVNYKHGAKLSDLREALNDPKYQHIAVIGHGARNVWAAKDGIVVTENLETYMADRPKKSGYWIQYTCGGHEGMPLGAPVVSDPNKVLGFTDLASPGDTIFGHFRKNAGLTALLEAA